MLTPDRRLVGNEEVQELAGKSGGLMVELMDLECQPATGFAGFAGKGGNSIERSEPLSFDLPTKQLEGQVLIDLTHPPKLERTASSSRMDNGRLPKTVELLSLSPPSPKIRSNNVPQSPVHINDARLQELVDLWLPPQSSFANTSPSFLSPWEHGMNVQMPPPPSLFPDEQDLSTAPSTPSIQSWSTSPTISAAVRNTAVSPRLSPAVVIEKLLDLDENAGSCFGEMESETLNDLAELSAAFTTASLGALNVEHVPSPQPTLNVIVSKDLMTETVGLVGGMSSENEVGREAPGEKVTVVKDTLEEAVVRRRSRRSTPEKITVVDPESADRAFSMFSQGIKSQWNQNK